LRFPALWPKAPTVGAVGNLKSAGIDMRLLFVITITSFGSVSGYIGLVNRYSKEIKNVLEIIYSERR